MSNVAINVRGLSKQYHIGKKRKTYYTLRETLSSAFVSPFRRAGKLLSGHATGAAELDEAIWALKDISFDVKFGEVVGIIGRNGAGKSTLLKILSRITEPTKGYGEIRGRVGSLLEVGTGFHGELTGRENIYLNGAILGMRRSEIGKKFDEIVAFSELDKFIDTPVKHYSTGMYMRLAFAVAAHLDPETLIIDEVLAVGDARFQRKCLDKMQNVSNEGRTVLFVSHNMAAITRLCPRAILLDEGMLIEDGLSPTVVGSYLNNGSGTTAEYVWPDINRAPGKEIVRLRAVRIKTEDGEVADAVDVRRPFLVDIEFEVLKPGHVILPRFCLNNEQEITVLISVDQDPNWKRRPRPRGRYVSTAYVPGDWLNEGSYFVSPNIVTINPNIPQLYVRNIIAFRIVDKFDGDSSRGDYTGKLEGVIRPKLQWTTTVMEGIEA